MKCPFCNQDDTRVVDSRPADDNSSIRRRRLCDACGRRFTTYEKVETIPLVVIKKDRTREQYDRRKIEDGVMRACYKRPTPIQKIREMLDEVEREIFNREEKGRSTPAESGSWRWRSCAVWIRWRTSALRRFIANSRMSTLLWMN